jgi:hypothetical protein
LVYCEERPSLKLFAMLFLISYAFLLRMPSEAIPVCARAGERCLKLEGGFLVLHLSRRKNKPEGSRLVRGCWCKESKTTCPLHVLGPWLEDCKDGSPLFQRVTAASALRVLRTVLAGLSFPHAAEYRTHDFRRGHAKDLQVSGRWLFCTFVSPQSTCCIVGGAQLWQILEAGEWRSPAFMKYLDVHRLETDLVVQAHIDDESESEDDVAASECGSLSVAADSSA